MEAIPSRYLHVHRRRLGFLGTLQLESTSATTVSIDSPLTDLQMYKDRFKDLGAPCQQQTTEKQKIIVELKSKTNTDNLVLATDTRIRTIMQNSKQQLHRKAYNSNIFCNQQHNIGNLLQSARLLFYGHTFCKSATPKTKGDSRL
ncbi:hypothetical protein L1987_01989 [Smallanthus sonchifolius]|uniref:Uncharacterized protein n=1 Tax=Smallanthus sonchifolius TaxID=185202 RepID=A0ACB9K6U1_9ASTR|nr:hypothetical protein L1987_01989 [Smallanthus sonchifolius]